MWQVYYYAEQIAVLTHNHNICEKRVLRSVNSTKEISSEEKLNKARILIYNDPLEEKSEHF